MDKSSSGDIPLTEQTAYWDEWNQVREKRVGICQQRQAEIVEQWLEAMPRGLDILEVGCGVGWLSQRLSGFGRVTGVDLSPVSVQRAQQRCPNGTFIAGDIFEVALPTSGFDVIVSFETLAHIVDKDRLMARFVALLRPGGHLMMSTQNRPVFENWSVVPMPAHGQVRSWVDAKQLKQLLKPYFSIDALISIMPEGDQGIYRWLNAEKLNRAVSIFVGRSRLDRFKERMMLGQTLMVLTSVLKLLDV